MTRSPVKVGILAGGLGVRLAGETETRPKALVEIGGKPILWHIMKHYYYHGFKDFVIALGYKGEAIKLYFNECCRLNSNPGAELAEGYLLVDVGGPEDWRVELVETGNGTATGGRIKRLLPHLGGGTFMLTYSDGVSTVDLHRLLAFHRSHGRFATVTAVRPPFRFGKLDLEGDAVMRFSEKPRLEDVWVNGAYFVLEPEVFDYIEGDETDWEREPLERLAKDGQLRAYRHETFWQCMDTPQDRELLQKLWEQGAPPWKVWE
jgi:glucose-1-phosphate cytidylyltransferase